jgi:hypothetical protein
MKAELVSSLPLQELRDNMLNPACYVPFQRYLEKACGCSCLLMADHSVVVRFPEGTVEEEYAGQSSSWRRETTLCLPNGVKLIKRVYPALMEGEKALVALVLPQSAWEKGGEQREHAAHERWRGRSLYGMSDGDKQQR